MKKKSLLIISILLGLFLSGCGAKENTPDTPVDPDVVDPDGGDGDGGEIPIDPDNPDPPVEPVNEDFKDVYFDSKTITYDGKSHILDEVRGAPEGTNIVYTGRNEYVNVGTYTASATLSKAGYNNKTLSATLTISKSAISGITFTDSTISYDGQPHTLTVSGTLPSGTSVQYINNGPFTNVGTYKMQAVISGANYDDLTLSATLTIKKINITGITFNSSTIVYDGQPHSIAITGTLPNGGSVTYTNNGPFTNAGVYQAKAVITAPNYNDLTLTATLTINKAQFTGVEFKDAEFEYDGNPHSIEITGALPSTATVTYSSDVSGVTNSATDIGEYNITATIKDNNFVTKTLTAKMTIKTEDDERYLKWSDDTLFFQNAKDDNYFYSFNEADSKLIKAGYDNAVDIIEYSTDSVMFVSKSLIHSAIKTAAYDTSKQTVDTSIALTAKARYVQYGGSNIVYYVVNGLTQNKSGIYKADLTNEEPVITCLSVGKAKYLTLVGNKLYFADGDNGYKFSSISTSGENQTRTLVVNEKINNLYYNSGYFYYTVNNLAGDYIERYSTVNGRRKLTSDAGIDLCYIDGYIYYINVDKLNTILYGEGIYKVNASPIADNNNAGTKVIESTQGVCSLTSDGTNLYYYDMDGYKLVKAQTDGTFVKDILDGFVKPEPSTPVSTGGDLEEYNGVLYYLDIWDEKTLHSYNPTTKQNVRLTSAKVDNFSIIGDVLYLNLVTRLVNNDIHRYNLKTGGDLENISSQDGNEFVSDGTYLYYAKDNEAGAATAITRIDLANYETTTETDIYDKGVSNLRMANGNLYFIDGYQIYSMDLDTLTTTEIKPNDKSVHTTAFDIDGINIYYREMYSVGYLLKRLSRYNMLTGTYSMMVTKSTDPISIVYKNGYVYYYNDTTDSSVNGLYKVSASATETTGITVLACNTTYYATTFAFVGSDVYFLNYNAVSIYGDSHIYKVPLAGGTPEKIA